jgi:hypothetical protein
MSLLCATLNQDHGPRERRTQTQESIRTIPSNYWKDALRMKYLQPCFHRLSVRIAPRKRSSTKKKKKISPEQATLRKVPEVDLNIYAARKWEKRINERIRPVPDSNLVPKEWRAELSADVELLHRLLVFTDQHFQKKGAGIKIAEASLKYLDRTKIPIAEETSRKLAIVSTLLAIKVDDDVPFCNTALAVCVQLSLSQLNALEFAFCQSVDWELVLYRVFSVSV